jgi:hypothetical protein
LKKQHQARTFARECLARLCILVFQQVKASIKHLRHVRLDHVDWKRKIDPNGS